MEPPTYMKQDFHKTAVNFTYNTELKELINPQIDDVNLSASPPRGNTPATHSVSSVTSQSHMKFNLQSTLHGNNNNIGSTESPVRNQKNSNSIA